MAKLCGPPLPSLIRRITPPCGTVSSLVLQAMPGAESSTGAVGEPWPPAGVAPGVAAGVAGGAGVAAGVATPSGTPPGAAGRPPVALVLARSLGQEPSGRRRASR